MSCRVFYFPENREPCNVAWFRFCDVIIRAPNIELDAVINYEMSFVWNESKRIPNEAVPNVIEEIRNRATLHAENRGIITFAEEAATRWFTAFFEAFRHPVEVRFGS